MMRTAPAEEFISGLEPCVNRLLAGTDPKPPPSGIPGIDGIAVVHANFLKDREEALARVLREHGLTNWSFIGAYDGDRIGSSAARCFFGQWVRRISGRQCCNRLSSVLKPHVAMFNMVRSNLKSLLILEDDLTVKPSISQESVQKQLARAARKLKRCDLVKVSKYAVAYLISNAGARKMLRYSLRLGGGRIANPQDWQMDEVARKRYRGFKMCDHKPHIFDHYGHGTNQGGGDSVP